MSYRLERAESLDEGLRRIAREQVEEATRRLRTSEEDLQEAVHDARKRLKKVRAVLRLARDDIGEDLFKEENACYRDAGRVLADVRDSWVMVETLEKLRSRFSDELAEGAFLQEKERLEERHRAVASRFLTSSMALEDVIGTLEKATERICGWPVSTEFEALLPGLERVYRRGRKGMAKAYDGFTFPDFHEWRKRVKYLWYHLRILRPAWREVMAAWAESLHAISNVVGESNDLSELKCLLEEEPDLAPEGTARQLLFALIDRRRRRLRSEARPLGERVYMEKPSTFSRRIGSYWSLVGGESGSPAT